MGKVELGVVGDADSGAGAAHGVDKAGVIRWQDEGHAARRRLIAFF